MPRWGPEQRLTETAFRALLDAHLFASMDSTEDHKSFLVCSCGKRLNASNHQYPEIVYRQHLARELAEFWQAILRAK